jgi:hypothetical protein
MIIHKLWQHTTHYRVTRNVKDSWLREGWFLFGFIPLYIRDRTNRD